VSRRRPVWAWGVAIASAGAFLASIPLLVGGRHGSITSGFGGNAPLLGQLVLLLVLASFTLVGLLIATARPGSRIGAILLATGAFWSAIFFSTAYSTYSYTINPLPGAGLLLAATQFLWVPAVGLLGVYTVLLFPDGVLPGRRWRWVAWIAGCAIVGLSIVITVDATSISTGGTPPTIANPLHVTLPPVVVSALELQLFVLLGCLVASAVSLVRRLRRASGEQREQYRWLAYAVSVIAAAWVTTVVVSLPFDSADVTPGWLGAIQNITLFLFALVPIAIGFAVLKYRLYDIDIVISKTIVFGALAAFITVVYVVLVVGLGALLGGSNNLALSIGATAVVAILFEPVRTRVQRIANRFVYGERATPYEVMAGFSARVSDTVSVDEVLPGMAAAAGEGVGAAEVAVRVFLPGGDERVERWTAANGAAADEAATPERTRVPTEPTPFVVRYQGEAIGEVDVRASANDPLGPAERELLEDLAGQAGLAMHNVRLTEELALRLRELDRQAAAIRASRERLVTARDAQRRGLQRDLHEGPERRLGEIAEAVAAASRPEDLDPLLDRANETLEGLRDLARGIFPPLLADKGIEAALEAHIRKVGAHATVEVDPTVAGVRFDGDTEACVYFCCLQAIQNVIRHADNAPCVVRLAVRDGMLTFAIADEGPGFDPATTSRGMGLDIMQDRVDALEGTLTVRSAPGKGTTVEVAVPIRMFEETPA
jgi:signal transduction histidine kinase